MVSTPILTTKFNKALENMEFCIFLGPHPSHQSTTGLVSFDKKQGRCVCSLKFWELLVFVVAAELSLSGASPASGWRAFMKSSLKGRQSPFMRSYLGDFFKISTSFNNTFFISDGVKRVIGSDSCMGESR